MAQGQRVGKVDVGVAAIAKCSVVVMAEDAGGVAVAQRAQLESRDIAHHVGAAAAQRGLALGDPDGGLGTLAPLALHRTGWPASGLGRAGDSWRNNLARGVQPKIEGEAKRAAQLQIPEGTLLKHVFPFLI